MAREEFHAAGMAAFANSDLVFFDPDNGMDTPSVSKSRAAGVKFVFDDELADHYAAGRSLLIYQHFPRVERTPYIQGIGARLRSFAPDAEIWACRTPHVVFMLVLNPSRPAAQNCAITAVIADSRRHWPEKFIKFEYLPEG